MNRQRLTVSDIGTQLEGAKWSGNELCGQCPLCGSSTGFSATENGKLIIHCHACNADLMQFVRLFSGGQAEAHHPAPKPTKPKPTPEQVTQGARQRLSASVLADLSNGYFARRGGAYPVDALIEWMQERVS